MKITGLNGTLSIGGQVIAEVTDVELTFKPLTSIPVFYSSYALDEPQFVPGIGIICKDRESLERWLKPKDVAELERIWSLESPR